MLHRHEAKASWHEEESCDLEHHWSAGSRSISRRACPSLDAETLGRKLGTKRLHSDTSLACAANLAFSSGWKLSGDHDLVKIILQGRIFLRPRFSPGLFVSVPLFRTLLSFGLLSFVSCRHASLPRVERRGPTSWCLFQRLSRPGRDKKQNGNWRVVLSNEIKKEGYGWEKSWGTKRSKGLDLTPRQTKGFCFCKCSDKSSARKRFVNAFKTSWANFEQAVAWCPPEWRIWHTCLDLLRRFCLPETMLGQKKTFCRVTSLSRGEGCQEHTCVWSSAERVKFMVRHWTESFEKPFVRDVAVTNHISRCRFLSFFFFLRGKVQLKHGCKFSAFQSYCRQKQHFEPATFANPCTALSKAYPEPRIHLN